MKIGQQWEFVKKYESNISDSNLNSQRDKDDADNVTL